jgi:hypothetical protein
VGGQRADILALLVKGAKTRIERPGHDGYTIQDRAERWGVTVSRARRTVTQGLFDNVPLGLLLLTPRSGASVVAMGKTDEVAGAVCDVYDVRQAYGDEQECCMVRTPFAPADGDESPWGKMLSLRSIVLNDAGNEQARIEVTKIEEEPLDASLFVVPAGYRTITEGFQR